MNKKVSEMKWFSTSVLAVAMSLLLGCQTTANTSQDSEVNIKSESQVAQMEKVNNYDGLIEHYKQQIAQNNNDVKAMENLAQTYLAKGDIESAQFWVLHLLHKGVSTANLYQLHGQISMQQGEAKTALVAYQDAVKAGQNGGQIYVLLGIAHSQLDEFSQAVEQFNQARLLGYDDLTIKNNLAVIYLAQQDYPKVIETLIPLLKQHPDNQVIKANLAVALFKTGQQAQAQKLLSDQFNDTELYLISRQLKPVSG
ncbi:tetratricopeptide repeat protein [Vibrio hippocampi]|nr:tetratricopeptide repeat protein [Vibrio hippocampi]